MSERKLKLIEELINQKRDTLNIGFLLDLIRDICTGKISIDGWEKELNILENNIEDNKEVIDILRGENNE